MRKIEREGERKVLLDTENDQCLWSGRKNFAGQNSPNRWLDFHAHKTRTKDKMVFYLAHYTCWQGETSYIGKLSLDDAQEFAEEHYDQLDCTDEELKAWGLVDAEKLE